MIRHCRLAVLAAAAMYFALAGPAAAQAKCEPATMATRYPALKGLTVRIGQSPTSPPYAFLESATSEKHVGFDADLARATFACIGTPAEIKTGRWAGLLPAVIAGQTEVMWSNLFYTPERAQQADFVTYRVNATSGVVRKGNPRKIASMEAICGLRAAALLGSIEEASFRKIDETCRAGGKPGVDVTTYPDNAAGLRLLANDRTDLILLDAGGAGYMMSKMADEIAIAFTNVTPHKVGVAVNKGLPQLRDAIHDALKVLQADGTQKALMERYHIDTALQTPTEILTK